MISRPVRSVAVKLTQVSSSCSEVIGCRRGACHAQDADDVDERHNPVEEPHECVAIRPGHVVGSRGIARFPDFADCRFSQPVGVVGEKAAGDHCQQKSDELGKPAGAIGVELFPEHGTIAEGRTKSEPPPSTQRSAQAQDHELVECFLAQPRRAAFDSCECERALESPGCLRLHPGGEKWDATARMQGEPGLSRMPVATPSSRR